MSAISNLDGSGLIGIEKLQKAFISIMPNFSNMIGNLFTAFNQSTSGAELAKTAFLDYGVLFQLIQLVLL